MGNDAEMHSWLSEFWNAREAYDVAQRTSPVDRTKAEKRMWAASDALRSLGYFDNRRSIESLHVYEQRLLRPTAQ